MKKKLIIIGLALVLFWAIFLRLYYISDQSVWMDEAYSLAIAQDIVEQGYPLAGSGEVVWRSPMYHFLLAGATYFRGDAILAGRLLSVLLGIATIIVISIIAKYWFSNRVAIITFVVMSFSYWEIAWSRQVRMYMLLQLLFWLALFLYDCWLQGKKKLLIWMMIITILTIMTHQFGYLVIFAFILLVVIKKLFNSSLKPGYLVTIFVSTILGMIISSVILVRIFFYNGPLVNYWNHYSNYIMNEQLALIILAVFGIWLLIKRGKVEQALWLSAIFLVGFGVLSYAVPLLHYRYLFFLFPAVVMLTAVAVDWLLSRSYLGWAVVVIFTVAYSGFVFLPQSNYALESDSNDSYLSYKSFTPQPDFKSAYEFLSNQQVDALITPYPAITRLYSTNLDDYSLYVDPTGRDDIMPEREIYTGVEYIDAETFEKMNIGEKNVYVLIDTLAKYRLSNSLLEMIEESKQVYRTDSGPWSELILYRL
ncbi:MAG: glycosyltransferase family 39 protein [bacterium]|nr:glycosyltransferase family 39 protein [bacterium]